MESSKAGMRWMSFVLALMVPGLSCGTTCLYICEQYHLSRIAFSCGCLLEDVCIRNFGFLTYESCANYMPHPGDIIILPSTCTNLAECTACCSQGQKLSSRPDPSPSPRHSPSPDPLPSSDPLQSQDPAHREDASPSPEPSPSPDSSRKKTSTNVSLETPRSARSNLCQYVPMSANVSEGVCTGILTFVGVIGAAIVGAVGTVLAAHISSRLAHARQQPDPPWV
eukprot:jgi/Botrbrau1/12617/Bobra.0169s0144.1